MNSQTILILGGGVGGVVAANQLRRRLDRRHRIIVVDREDRFAFAASFLWVMTGDRRPDQVTRPLDRLQRKGIEVVHGTVERLDPERREAVVDGRTIQADHVIVALGAEFALDAIPGMAAEGLTFCTLDGAERLRGELGRFAGGRIVVLTAAPAYKCPAAPYEAALLIERLVARRGLRGRTDIAVYAAEPAPMGVAGPAAGAALRAMLEQRSIAYHPGRQVTGVAARRLRFSDGTEAEFDLLVYVPGVRPPAVLANSGLVDESGWVRVDRQTLQTRFPGVYALGDVTMIPLAVGKPLPRAGVFAHGQAEVVARNIARAVRGDAPSGRYDGHGACFIEAGAGLAGYGSGNFYAEPTPEVRMRPPSRWWHLGKVLFERQVLWQWF